MQITVPANKSFQKLVLAFFLFLVLSLLLFWPVLQHGFVSDDFQVLYRIIYRKIIFAKGFFRPLSDISLYGSYLVGGLSPVYYNITNIIIHGSCAFLLYRLCLINSFLAAEKRSFFAWFAAFLFLIYPFHNEAVIWAIGRGILLSAFFGFLSLLMVFLQMSNLKKCLLSCLFYFIGLCGYETIIPLPFIIIVLLYTKNKSIKSLMPFASGYLITLLINLAVRIQISGRLWYSYGAEMFSLSPVEYGVRFIKAGGRLLLPPSGFGLLIICFIILLLCTTIAGGYILNRKNNQSDTYFRISLVTFISFILPAMFGISTTTFEGDRIFYFSSFFVCMWIAFQVALLKNNIMRQGICTLIAGYFLFFFYQSLLSWKKSSNMAQEIIKTVHGTERRNSNIYLLNMPEESDGAQVFRNGFIEALLINNIDTTGIKIINYLSTKDAKKITGNIQPVKRQGYWYIFPNALVSNDLVMAKIRANINNKDSVYVKYDSTVRIFYWNKKSLVLLSNTLPH